MDVSARRQVLPALPVSALQMGTPLTHTELHAGTAEPTGATTEDCACPGGCGSRGRGVTRRTAIGAGVVAGAALVAACGGSDAATTPSTTSSTTTSAGTPGSTGSSSSSSTSSTGESSTADPSAGSSAAAPNGTEIAKVADIPEGGSLVVANGDDSIALARNADGSVVAHSAICTHQGCAVNADGASLRCPCHGSTFDAFTGAVTKPPADAPLAAVSVAVDGDAVYLTA